MKQFVNEYDEALNALTSGMLDTSDIEPYMDTIVKALKKQIPVKSESTPLVDNMKHWYRCPNCDMWILKYSQYCDVCGQLLDWELDESSKEE